MQKIHTLGFDETLFWDVNLEKIDPEVDSFYIIKRVILSGDKKDRNILYSLYDNQKILEVILKSREIPESLKEIYQMALGENT